MQAELGQLVTTVLLLALVVVIPTTLPSALCQTASSPHAATQFMVCAIWSAMFGSGPAIHGIRTSTLIPLSLLPIRLITAALLALQPPARQPLMYQEAAR